MGLLLFCQSSKYQARDEGESAIFSSSCPIFYMKRTINNILLQVLPALIEQCRPLSVHEHYSLELMSSYGVSVPKGKLAFSPKEAKQVATDLGMYMFLLRAYLVMFLHS